MDRRVVEGVKAEVSPEHIFLNRPVDIPKPLGVLGAEGGHLYDLVFEDNVDDPKSFPNDSTVAE